MPGVRDGGTGGGSEAKKWFVTGMVSNCLKRASIPILNMPLVAPKEMKQIFQTIRSNDW